MNCIAERSRLPGPIQAIAFNVDCSAIAVSHCGNDVVIYEACSGASGSGEALSWTKVSTLQGHQQVVSGLDWAPRTDQILSCSHDRNAFVWTRTSAAAAASTTAPAASTAASGPSGSASGSETSTRSASWEKQMVITRLTKGALCVKWSPSEAKFAIGSAAKVVSVGYYDPESKWWACKMIRKAHESSVVAVAWHPNSLVLATGSTDRRVRLFNAYVQGYETEAPAGSLPPNSSFGDCIIEVSHEGCSWVHSVCWSPGDEALLYASHDGAVGYVRGPQANVVVRLAGQQLPLKCLEAVSERLAVGAGWDGCLVVLTRRSAQEPWQQAAYLGGPSSSSGNPSLGGSSSSHPSQGGSYPAGSPSIVRHLAQMHISASTPGGTSTAGASGQPAAHTACVTGLHVRPAAAAAATAGANGRKTCAAAAAAAVGGQARWHVASAGLDGQVVLWDLSAYM
ncbi:hypothetical protein Agub_g10116 [Astrephomene gubernaculifera]|uniref:Arp2/3 complex 41 kDa subunit n=1 Tax=Astrephomene gubernaculifera TaxID=47775 RepID=A0AAD3DUI1_9CHLO|nr:hypothetical protein Agub_g10116 [Astrephomene gubernaculifera]